MSYLYKETRTCVCGYSTMDRSAMSKHSRICSKRPVASDGEKDQLRERVTLLEQQLAVKDEQLAAKDRQMSEKDEQIKQLIKRPRTVMNNRFVVNNSVNCFGRESLEHITEEKYQELLRDPETSVAKVVALQRTVPENDNVVIPNVRERRWLVV